MGFEPIKHVIVNAVVQFSFLIHDFLGKSYKVVFCPYVGRIPGNCYQETTVEILEKNPSAGEAKQRLRLDAKLPSLR